MNVLLEVGAGLIPDLIPFKEGTKEQKQNNSRVLVSKKGHLIRRITRDELEQIDKSINLKNDDWRNPKPRAAPVQLFEGVEE